MRSRGAVRFFELPTFADSRGSLSVAEVESEIPFEPKRVFVLHDLRAGVERGGHANRDEQVLMAMVGALEVRTNDGAEERTYVLDSPGSALYIGPIVWRTLLPLRDESVCMSLSSLPYDPANYVMDFDEFLKLAKEFT